MSSITTENVPPKRISEGSGSGPGRPRDLATLARRWRWGSHSSAGLGHGRGPCPTSWQAPAGFSPRWMMRRMPPSPA